jgi:RNA polymerase subunit RPABC4/transcription elongation factor Spt4
MKLKLTMACMKCNRAVEVGALCPICATPEDTEYAKTITELMEELTIARMLIREFGDRLAKLESTNEN